MRQQCALQSTHGWPPGTQHLNFANGAVFVFWVTLPGRLRNVFLLTRPACHMACRTRRGSIFVSEIASVSASDGMTMLYSEKCLRKLWIAYELASFLKLKPSAMTFMPADQFLVRSLMFPWIVSPGKSQIRIVWGNGEHQHSLYIRNVGGSTDVLVNIRICMLIICRSHIVPIVLSLVHALRPECEHSAFGFALTWRHASSAKILMDKTIAMDDLNKINWVVRGGWGLTNQNRVCLRAHVARRHVGWCQSRL